MSLILAAGEDTLKSYLRKGVDCILESTHLVTEYDEQLKFCDSTVNSRRLRKIVVHRNNSLKTKIIKR